MSSKQSRRPLDVHGMREELDILSKLRSQIWLSKDAAINLLLVYYASKDMVTVGKYPAPPNVGIVITSLTGISATVVEATVNHYKMKREISNDFSKR